MSCRFGHVGGLFLQFVSDAWIGYDRRGSCRTVQRCTMKRAPILITLVLLGKLFEALAKGRTSQAIKSLMGLQAKTALVVT